MKLPVEVEARLVVDMVLLLVDQALVMVLPVEVEAQLVVVMVLLPVDLAQDMVLPVEVEAQQVMDMVEQAHQMIKTANKFRSKTAKVFLFKFQGNKGKGNKEQFVKLPTLVVEVVEIITVVVVVCWVDYSIMVPLLLVEMEEVEGQAVVEVVPMVEEEEDLLTLGNKI